MNGQVTFRMTELDEFSRKSRRENLPLMELIALGFFSARGYSNVVMGAYQGHAIQKTIIIEIDCDLFVRQRIIGICLIN
jgi:hypothetical protein